MSANKVKEQLNIITDFTNKKITTSKVLKELRSANVIEYITFKDDDDDRLAIINNKILVGDYIIELILPRKANATKLRDYGNFGVVLKENLNTINVQKNRIFKNQKWSKKINNKLRIKDLVDMIIFCGRLHKLRLFL